MNDDQLAKWKAEVAKNHRQQRAQRWKRKVTGDWARHVARSDGARWRG
jgi:hypothetical protein